MTLKLIRTALVILTLIGFILALQVAEQDFSNLQAIGSVGIMLVGAITLGMSFCVDVKEKK